jgi:hypothetical protein
MRIWDALPSQGLGASGEATAQFLALSIEAITISTTIGRRAAPRCNVSDLQSRVRLFPFGKRSKYE